jgi:tetratricopeptide (TPR) repeat protein
MDDRPPSGFIAEHFIARENQLAVLEDSLAHALQGRGSVIFVTGKAGAGKSWLLEAFIERAETAYPRILSSKIECSLRAQEGDLFQPFDDLITDLESKERERGRISWWLRRYKRPSRSGTGRISWLGGWLGDFVGLFVGPLGFLIKAVSSAIQSLFEARSERGDGLSPFRERLLRLEQLSKRWPLLLGFDDFQRADAKSCALLQDLNQQIAQRSILLVVAFRPLEGLEDRPLHPVWSELVTRRGVQEIRLDDLIETETDQRKFVDAYLKAVRRGNTFDDKFRDEIARRTEGLPWFVDELVKLCEEKGWIREVNGCWTQVSRLGSELPRSTDEFIRKQRWIKLESEDQERLKAAAVDGETFTFTVLVETLREELDRLRRRLDNELRSQEWVRPGEPRRLAEDSLHQYRFWHTFYYEFVSRQLTGEALKQLHGRVGAAKRIVWGDHWKEIAGTLAEHFTRGGNWAEASTCYESQLEHLERLGAPDQRLLVLINLADALYRSGELDASIERYQQAATLAQEVGAMRQFTRACEGLAWALFESGKYAESLPAFERSIASYTTEESVGRRLYFGLAVVRLATDSRAAALDSLEYAIRADDPDKNDRLDESDVQDARHWLHRLREQGVDPPGVDEALRRLESSWGA